MERHGGEREPLLGHNRGNGTSINNPGGLLDTSSDDNSPTASVTYGHVYRERSVQLEAHHVYKRRWYCLLLYSLLCFIFGLAQTAITPIAHSMQLAFAWSHAAIAVISSLPILMFLLSIVFCTWLLESKGIRVTCLFGAFGLAVGTGVRCITSTPPWCNWTFNIGQFLVGIPAAVVYSSPPMFSNVWFPPDQRTTATSIATIGNALGFGAGSVLAPYLVPFRRDHNASIHNNFITPVPQGNTTGLPADILEIRKSIMRLMYIEFGLSLAIFLALLIYFPSKPPTPPSASASSDRVHFWHGLRTILRLPRFWLIGGIFAISTGSIAGTASLLDVNLNAAKVPGDQEVSGFLALSSILASVVACIIISSIADRLPQCIKYMLLVIFALCAAAFTWFSLIIEGVAPHSYASLYSSYILGYLLVMSSVPVFMELACDTAYPISEGITTGVLSVLSNIISLIFFAVLMVPDLGTQWINWAMVGSAALCVPLLIPFTPSPGRMQVDSNRKRANNENSPSDGPNTADA